MAAATVPASLSSSLHETEQMANENHNAGFVSHENATAFTAQHKDIDVEREKNASSNASIISNLEKGQPVTIVTEEESDANIVDFAGPEDLTNPLNWTSRKKWGNIALLSALTLLTPLASSMFAPGVPEALAEFKTHNNLLATFVVSVYLLGFAM